MWASSFVFQLIEIEKRWVFIAVHGLSLAVLSGDYSLVAMRGFSLKALLVAKHTLQAHGLQ